jgi:CheY-like chemotaxis protein
MTTAAKVSIVVANDSRPSLGLVSDVLEQAGYSVVPCTDRGQVHDIVRATMPALILLDSRGAEVPNWHASAMLKLDAQTSSIPVLLCLTDNPEQLAIATRAAAMGCGILITPFEPTDLLTRVRELLGEPVGAPPHAPPGRP